MSLRVEKVEPICSTKSSTQKQKDSYRLWRAQISSHQTKQHSQLAQSFQDVLASVIEDSDAVQNLPEAKKKWKYINPFYFEWSTFMKNKTFNILSIIFSLLFLLIFGFLVIATVIVGIRVVIASYASGCNILEIIIVVVSYLVFDIIPGIMFAGCWMAFRDFIKSLVKWRRLQSLRLTRCSGRERVSSLALSFFIWHEKRLVRMKFFHFFLHFSSLLS